MEQNESRNRPAEHIESPSKRAKIMHEMDRILELGIITIPLERKPVPLPKALESEEEQGTDSNITTSLPIQDEIPVPNADQSLISSRVPGIIESENATYTTKKISSDLLENTAIDPEVIIDERLIVQKSEHDASDEDNEEEENEEEENEGEENEEEENEEEEDEEEEEELGEPFVAYKPKVIQLCHDIRLSELLEIEEMCGGGSHRVIGLKFASEDNADCILRVPRIPWNTEDQSSEVSDQVALLRFLSRFDFLHTTHVLSYDATIRNVLESQYCLSTRLPGQSIDCVYYELPLREKLEVVSLVAELIIQMETIEFPRPGRFVAKNYQRQWLCSRVRESTNYINITGFRASPVVDMPEMASQSLICFIIALLKFRETESSVPWEEMSIRCRKLQRIAFQMERAGLIRTTDNQNFLWHWDFAARNVLMQRKDISDATRNKKTATRGKAASSDSAEIQLPTKDNPKKWEITGVIDWDDAFSVPLIISRRPPAWLWFREEYRENWDGQNDTKPHRDLVGDELLIKAYFDQLMSNASPTYIEDAYHRGVWIRELVRFGLQGCGDIVDWERWEPFVLKWDKHFASTGLRTLDDDKDDQDMVDDLAGIGVVYDISSPHLHVDPDETQSE